MSDDDKADTPSQREEMRQCSMCKRTVPSTEGAYVGGGRWCCYPCAAVLYYDEDDDPDDH